MKHISFPVVRPDGESVSLKSFFARLPEHGFVWSVLYFYGVGIPPRNMDMVAFEAACLEAEQGFLISWTELKEFVEHVDQVFDCLIAASVDPARIDAAAVRNGDFSSCDFVLSFFDSTRWEIAYDEAQEASFGAVREAIS